MPKAAKTLCDRCGSRMAVGDPFCGACGHPTTWASHDERTAWEVAQYREKTATAPISKIADDAPRKHAAARVDVMDRPGAPRERKTLSALFGRRRSHSAMITLPEPKRVEPPVAEPDHAPTLTMVRPEPAPVPAPKLERPTAKPDAAPPKADGLVSKVERAMNDNEGLIDTPATVLAMRLLNQRVRELDEKVQRLERELEAAKATPAAEPEKSRKRFER